MKYLITIMLFAQLTACSTSDSEWKKMVVDAAESCKPGSTAGLTMITGSFNRQVEVSCTWIVKGK